MRCMEESDFDVTMVEGHSGLWEDDNYILDHFEPTNTTDLNYEKVHHKNVGDLSVDRDFGMFTQTGQYAPIRVNVVGNKFNRKAVSRIQEKKRVEMQNPI